MEEVYLCYMTEQDKFRNLNFRENILKSLPKQNKTYVQKQLNLIYNDFMKYTEYVAEEYNRNVFVDGIQHVKVQNLHFNSNKLHFDFFCN